MSEIVIISEYIWKKKPKFIKRGILFIKKSIILYEIHKNSFDVSGLSSVFSYGHERDYAEDV